VVLDFPHVVEPDPVGDLDLLEGVMEKPVFAAFGPRTRILMLVEDAELHVVAPSAPVLGAGVAVRRYVHRAPVSCR
jgi:hypothetical protein